ncbi:major facilitator superfamily domain-containing protein [Myxozyma melibiosi]|uniref:Major facilitator superfamily domain-containing protein n=1 Tax=Myxozyma melibiosi TaxID=54550 RepID=A0ABR1EZL5_9ASCO
MDTDRLVPDPLSPEPLRVRVHRRDRSRARSRSRSRSPLPDHVQRSLDQQQYSGAHFHNAYSPMRAESPSGAGGHDEIRELGLNRTLTSATAATVIDEYAELGVQKAEALAQTWTRRGLHCAYMGLFLLAFTTSLSGQVTALLTPFATSEFHVHSLLAMVQVVQGILFAVVKTPMAKIANAFGRPEAFTLALVLLCAGYLQMSLAGSVSAYASAQIFSASGTTGLLILQQIFVADTTDLLNRALFSVLPDTPFLVTVFIAPWLTDISIEKFTWRVGYSVWVLLVPLAASPLLITLFHNQRRARSIGLIPKFSWGGTSLFAIAKSISGALDLLGILLFTSACSMVLIPLTLSSTLATHWHDPRISGLLIGGTILFIIFIVWELYLAKRAELDPHSNTTRPRPLLSLRVLENRTVRSGCVTIFFYDLAYNIFQPYFFSYLMVTRPMNTDTAGRIVQIFSFAATVAGITVSLLIKRSHRYKRWLLMAIPIYQIGILTMHFTRVPNSHTFFVVFSQVMTGAGGGLLSVPTQIGVQASCSHSDVALATAMFLTVFSLGSAVGASISGAIWTSLLPSYLKYYLPEDMQSEVYDIYGDFEYARQHYPDLSSPERQSIVAAYKDVMAVLIWVAFFIVIPAFISALFMTEYDLEELSKLAEEHARAGYGILNKNSDDEADDDDEAGSFIGSVHPPIIVGSHVDRSDDGDAILEISSDEEEDALGAGVGVAASHRDVVQDPLRVGKRRLL